MRTSKRGDHWSKGILEPTLKWGAWEGLRANRLTACSGLLSSGIDSVEFDLASARAMPRRSGTRNVVEVSQRETVMM